MKKTPAKSYAVGTIVQLRPSLESMETALVVAIESADRYEVLPAFPRDLSAAAATGTATNGETALRVASVNMSTVAWEFDSSPQTIAAGDIRKKLGQLDRADVSAILKAITLEWSKRFARLQHGTAVHWCGSPIEQPQGKRNPVAPYAGRVFGEDEIAAVVDAGLDFWLTHGKESAALEIELARRLGVRHSLLVNSGSSANLLAISALCSHKLPKSRRLLPGDEVITCASGFPTTVAPIIQNRLVPVFIDNDPVTLNPRVEQLEAAYVPGKTKAVIFAHAMGNPFDLATVLAFCQKHELWLIEDNCDALGSVYAYTDANGKRHERLTGSFGDLSTQSFYPPHHLTMGEGGAVNIVRETRLKKLVESYRDWGRDCWCASGADNTCNNRFGWQLGELPEGYDHKYIYSHIGYNLKPIDLQAAIGRVQLRRLEAFGAARRANWQFLRKELDDLSACFEFCLPTHASGWSANRGYLWGRNEQRRSDPSWFGFALRVRPGCGFSRAELARFLDAANIGNRAFFGGNLVRQPALVQLRRESPDAFRVAGDLAGADEIMHQALFVGVYPGLNHDRLQHIVERLHAFCKPYL